MRIDSYVWQESCMKMQQIRGSHPLATLGPDDGINNVHEAIAEVEDDEIVNWKYDFSGMLFLVQC